jgi:uncharacterized protein (TIGR02145 family)
MTPEEESKFKQIVLEYIPDIPTFNYSWYEVLGLKHFGDYIEDNYTDRYKYIKDEIRDPNQKDLANRCLSKAKTTLTNPAAKKQYDPILKKLLIDKLKTKIEHHVKIDNKLDKKEEEDIKKDGNSFGLTAKEISELITKVLKETGSIRKEEAKPIKDLELIIPHDVPVLAISGKKAYNLNNVKRKGEITFLNTSNENLEVTANWEKKWLKVTPQRFFIGQLPRIVTIKVDPSKVKDDQFSFEERDTISFKYKHGKSEKKENVSIRFSIEGEYLFIKRYAKNATIITGAIAFLLFLFFFISKQLQGFELFGLIIFVVVIFVYSLIKSQYRIISLIFYGIISIISNWIVAIVIIIGTAGVYCLSRSLLHKFPYNRRPVQVVSFIFLILIFLFYWSYSQKNIIASNTKTLPVLVTSVDIIKSNEAIFGENISFNGEEPIAVKGVCWSTKENPTIDDNKTIDSTGVGFFKNKISGLLPSTTYYVRAYAINNIDTTYGNQVRFTTASLNRPMITTSDIDGNIYDIVTIGKQMWMKENLKTSKYNDGTNIPLVTDNDEWAELTSPTYCWYNNDQITYKATYGALYNWYTVNTGKLCPTGWHIPSDKEWSELIIYLGNWTIAGGKMKEIGTTHWANPNIGATNKSGFTGLPGGGRWEHNFVDINESGGWWTSTEYLDSKAFFIGLYREHAFVLNRKSINDKGDSINDGAATAKWVGFSVRCVRDQVAK